MKKMISILLSFAMTVALMPNCVFSAGSTYIVNTDFESEASGDDPSGFTLGEGGGNVEVKELYNNKAVLIENTNDGRYTTLKKEFGKKLSKIPLHIELSYMQNDVKKDGVVIAAVGYEQIPIVTLETESGNIIYRSGGITRMAIVENYLANRWYNIALEINLLTKTATVKLNSTVVAENLPVNGTDADYFSSYTCYSPGHYVDNIKVYTNQEQGSIKLTGPDKISIPKTGTRSYTYTATVMDESGVAIEGAAVEYMPTLPSGVSKSEDGNTLTLTVDSTATATSFDIYVKSKEDISIDFTKAVDLTEDALSSIEIQGAPRICYRSGDENRFAYKAVLLNSTSDEMEGNVTWSLEGSVPPEVTIDQNGVITTSGKLDSYRNTHITLKATSNEDSSITQSYDIMLLDWKTCMQDNDRVNILPEFLDEVLKLGNDKWHNSPLIADGYNTLTDEAFVWNYPTSVTNPAPVVLSDLASQGNLMRIMDRIGEWIYDDKYRDRVDAIHQYFSENYFSEKNNLPYWGGHAAVDLKTATPTEATPDTNTHELKDNFVYLDAFGRIDINLPLTIAKSVWGTHMEDVSKDFNFNRHAHYTDELNLSWWEMDYDDDIDRPELISTTDCSFRLAANDYIYMMADAYKFTKDETALKWARRFWKKFADVCDPETALGGYVITSAYGIGKPHPYELDPSDKGYMTYEEWEKKVLEFSSEYADSKYGDRAYEQFKDAVVEAGLMTETEADSQCREANALFGPGYMEFAAQPSEFILVDALKSTQNPQFIEWAKQIEDYNVTRLSNYTKFAYNFETNKCKPIWANGVDMTGFIVTRPGYYYNTYKDYVMREEAVTEEMFFAYATVFSKTAHRTDLAEGRKVIWDTIRDIAIAKGLGDWGEFGTDAPNVNMKTSNSEAGNVILLSYLYNTTKNTKYLDLARRVADNMIDTYYHNRIFKESTSYKNIRWCGDQDAMPYSLYLLEHAIRGTLDTVQYYCPNGAQFTANLIEEYTGRNLYKKMSRWHAWAKSIDSVKVQSIKTDEEEYTLSQGEERKIDVTIYPGDAANKTISWYNSNPSVARFNSGSKTLTAYTKGETTLTGFSGDRNTFVKFKVIVE